MIDVHLWLVADAGVDTSAGATPSRHDNRPAVRRQTGRSTHQRPSLLDELLHLPGFICRLLSSAAALVFLGPRAQAGHHAPFNDRASGLKRHARLIKPI